LRSNPAAPAEDRIVRNHPTRAEPADPETPSEHAEQRWNTPGHPAATGAIDRAHARAIVGAIPLLERQPATCWYHGRADAMTNPLERSLETPPPPQPTLLRGVIFRFAFVYWGLYCFLILCMNTIDISWLTTPVSHALGAFGVWVGKHVLGISYDFSGDGNGSGDKTADWVLVLCIAVIALVATVVWSIVDRRRARDAWLREVIRIAVRYTLAFTVLGYGIIKLFFGQFSPPSPGRLVQNFGDASPMGLLWTFMGASRPYVFFSGAMETLGAGLLLFRRTTMLGAMVLTVVLFNVMMLNFCYDVPVKLISSHYLAMAIFLLLPDLRRLANVTVLQRIAHPVSRDLVLPKTWMRVTRLALKYGVIALIVAAHLWNAITWSRAPAVVGPAPWYDGHWTVTSFHRDGREVPMSVSEPARWTRIRFQPYKDKVLFRWRLTGNAYGDLYDAVVDDKARTVSLTFDKDMNNSKSAKPGLERVTLTYVRPGDGRLELSGQIGTDNVSMQLERIDTSNMLLTTRGFHWINEVPFNR
jgi:hypothetical protein